MYGDCRVNCPELENLPFSVVFLYSGVSGKSAYIEGFSKFWATSYNHFSVLACYILILDFILELLSHLM